MTDQTQVNLTEPQELQFSFRQNKETKIKRPDVAVTIQVPTAQGIIAALQSGDKKVVDLITDQVVGLIQSQLRTFIDADPEFKQESADKLADQLTLEAIANLPRAERNTVSKEDLEQFAADYNAIMPEATGKSAERVAAAASLFVERFKRAAGDNEVLNILQDQLGVFVEKAPEEVVERNNKAIQYFMNKLKELLSLKVTASAL